MIVIFKKSSLTLPYFLEKQKGFPWPLYISTFSLTFALILYFAHTSESEINMKENINFTLTGFLHTFLEMKFPDFPGLK